MKEIYVIDACALIAYFNDEDGADKVAYLFKEALRKEVEVLMPAINLCEVYYDCLRIKGEKKAKELLEKIELLPVSIQKTLENDLLMLAGKFKVEESVSLADSFALGLAKLKEAKLVTSDHHEFDTIEEKGLLEFEWIR